MIDLWPGWPVTCLTSTERTARRRRWLQTTTSPWWSGWWRYRSVTQTRCRSLLCCIEDWSNYGGSSKWSKWSLLKDTFFHFSVSDGFQKVIMINLLNLNSPLLRWGRKKFTFLCQLTTIYLLPLVWPLTSMTALPIRGVTIQWLTNGSFYYKSMDQTDRPIH